MNCNFVFQDDQELHRLTVQNRLLREYEFPVLRRILSGKSNVRILDIGCNDGHKTVNLFSDFPGVQVIGLEYLEDLAAKAVCIHGNEQFTFCHCDVEDADFPQILADVMEAKKVEAFDVIYLSFVLMHLDNPERLLVTLQQFLTEDGRVIIVEPSDCTSELIPDEENLLGTFLDILSKDPLAGNRTCGYDLPSLLKSSGYRDIILEVEAIEGRSGEFAKKEDIFETFFSYLPQDLYILCDQEPENLEYKDWKAWMELHYEALKQSICCESSEISMGLRIISCAGGSK
ncbi:MAG: class I SAM-dependent methyltransferase [Bariatricus sp.]